jgi:1-acyl-sn-glycerol-3-phosphate acyltransferase
MWCESNIFMCKNLCGLDYKIIGAEKIPDKKGIVFIKHSSVYELFVGLLLFSPSSWVAKHELMYLPLFRKAIKVFGFIPVKRGLGKSEVSRVIRDGTARLSEGNWIVIFPEGTRVPHGKTKRYGLSGALLAVGTSSNITPIAHNAGRYWGRRSLIKKRGSVVFSVGSQISTFGKSYDEINKEAKTWIDAETKRIDGL